MDFTPESLREIEKDTDKPEWFREYCGTIADLMVLSAEQELIMAEVGVVMAKGQCTFKALADMYQKMQDLLSECVFLTGKIKVLLSRQSREHNEE